MATVTVYRVTADWPKGDSEEGELDLTTVDLEVNSKHVRWGTAAEGITSAADVQTLAEEDADNILDLDNNGSRDTEFPLPPAGTLKPEYIPDPFDI